jgi:hypothetical protein
VIVFTKQEQTALKTEEKAMKRTSLVILISVFVFGFTLMVAHAQMGGGMMGGPQQQQQYQQGGYGMGPGMMGYGMGPGMMGYGMGPGMMGYGMGPGMMGQGMGPGMMGYGMGPGMMGQGMGPGMMGYGMGPGMMNVYNPQMKEFLDETKDLRKKLHTLQFDYSEALRDPETKPETITKLKNEMKDLFIRLQKKAPNPYGGY